MQDAKPSLFRDLFCSQERLSPECRNRFVRFDPAKFGVLVALSIDAVFAFHNVKKVTRFCYWLIAFYDVNDLAAWHVHPHIIFRLSPASSTQSTM
jgi:hypothetical protein